MDEVMDLRVMQIRHESDVVHSLLLADPDGGQLPSWEPGAHIDVTTPGGLRQYSLCGDTEDRYHYRIGVLREEASRGGSAFVHDRLRPGEILEVGVPRNNFPFSDAESYLFIAGGIGITPLLAMIRAAEQAGRPWRLVYGGRHEASMAFTAELAAYGDKVELVPERERGPLDLGALLDPHAPTTTYVCGPEGLLSAIENRFGDRADELLHVERFAARAPDPGLENRPFVVECRRSGVRLEVPARRSLLEVVEDAGLELSSACREGICGSCEIAVVNGAVEHRDSVLTNRQHSGDDLIMACVSRAAGPSLVLDL